MSLYNDSDHSKEILLEKLIPVWEKLEDGNTEWIEFSFVDPELHISHMAVNNGHAVVSMEQIGGFKCRFYKDRDGVNGMDWVDYHWKKEHGQIASTEGTIVDLTDKKIRSYFNRYIDEIYLYSEKNGNH